MIIHNMFMFRVVSYASMLPTSPSTIEIYSVKGFPSLDKVNNGDLTK
jgi:hypothetical protein